jgi:glycosyltransferase involved in cell wall biosynthesis
MPPYEEAITVKSREPILSTVADNIQQNIKVVHVPFGYLPDTMGGTEVYVAGLAQQLRMFGVSSSIIAPGKASEYVHDGIGVTRIPASPQLSLEALYGDGDVSAARQFGHVLDSVKPSVVHFHALTAGASLAAMREAAHRQISAVLTFHTPTVTCLRGTMLLWGRNPCDGLMRATRCAACNLHGLGMPKWIARGIALIPERLSRLAARRAPAKLATVLGMRWLATVRHKTSRASFELCQFIVSPCNWVSQVLTLNGVPASKLILSRQGLALSGLDHDAALPKRAVHDGGDNHAYPSLRLVFLGRIHPTKGLHTLLQALALNPQLAVTLAIYGAWSADDAYANEILKLAAMDFRISVQAPLPHEKVVSALAAYDAVVVPSEWLETGPLVVYEAFAAGLPVIGSNLGGIAELVSDGVNGMLVNVGDARAWCSALAEITDNRDLIRNWRKHLPSVRTMREVAEDMHSVYTHTLRKSHTNPDSSSSSI